MGCRMKGFLLGVFLVLIFPSVAYGKEDYSDISDYDFSDIQEILDACIAADQTEKLKAQSEE